MTFSGIWLAYKSLTAFHSNWSCVHHVIPLKNIDFFIQWKSSCGTVPWYGHNRGIGVIAQKWFILMHSVNAWNLIISALLLEDFITALFQQIKHFRIRVGLCIFFWMDLYKYTKCLLSQFSMAIPICGRLYFIMIPTLILQKDLMRLSNFLPNFYLPEC